jgi:hypothetical protein
MLHRFLLASVASASILATATDATAGFFRRCKSSVAPSAPPYVNWVPANSAPPCVTWAPVGPIGPVSPAGPVGGSTASPSTNEIVELAKKLGKEEQEHFQELYSAGWFVQIAIDAGKDIPADANQEDVLAINNAEAARFLTSPTADDRKKLYDYFKNETAPLTAEEQSQFLEMVVGNLFKPSQLLEYTGQRVSQRAKIYKTFKEKGGSPSELTPEELKMFLETVAANKVAKKSGFDDEKTYFPIWQAMTPAQRKAIWDAKGK